MCVQKIGAFYFKFDQNDLVGGPVSYRKITTVQLYWLACLEYYVHILKQNNCTLLSLVYHENNYYYRKSDILSSLLKKHVETLLFQSNTDGLGAANKEIYGGGGREVQLSFSQPRYVYMCFMLPYVYLYITPDIQVWEFQSLWIQTFAVEVFYQVQYFEPPSLALNPLLFFSSDPAPQSMALFLHLINISKIMMILPLLLSYPQRFL